MKNKVDLKNLKIFISVDIEGICGICDWSETELGEKDYEYFREEMIQETVACCNSLIEMGIENITVRDAHDSARNITPNRLPKCVKLIRGWTEAPCDMMAGLDESYDAVIFIGYHSKATDEGNPLSHTLSTTVPHIKINGEIVSEYLVNTYYAQILKGVPVIMLCGDEALTLDAKSRCKNISVVATNKGVGGAIITKHPSLVHEEISQKVKDAIQLLQNGENFFINTPSSFTTEIQFRKHSRAYRASFYPKAKYLGANVTNHTSDDFYESLLFINFTL